MHADDNQVIYDAVAEESTTHPEAKIIEMTLVAKDGKITITDVTNGKHTKEIIPYREKIQKERTIISR